MNTTIAANRNAELTWYDAFDCREAVEIILNTEYADSSGAPSIRVKSCFGGGELELSLMAWEGLVRRIRRMLSGDGLRFFIDMYRLESTDGADAIGDDISDIKISFMRKGE